MIEKYEEVQNFVINTILKRHCHNAVITYALVRKKILSLHSYYFHEVIQRTKYISIIKL